MAKGLAEAGADLVLVGRDEEALAGGEGRVVGDGSLGRDPFG